MQEIKLLQLGLKINFDLDCLEALCIKLGFNLEDTSATGHIFKIRDNVLYVLYLLFKIDINSARSDEFNDLLSQAESPSIIQTNLLQQYHIQKLDNGIIKQTTEYFKDIVRCVDEIYVTFKYFGVQIDGVPKNLMEDIKRTAKQGIIII